MIRYSDIDSPDYPVTFSTALERSFPGEEKKPQPFRDELDSINHVEFEVLTGQVPSFIVFRGQFDLSELSVLNLTVPRDTAESLGVNGLKRLHDFAQIPDGWDAGQGKKLKRESLEVMLEFLRLYQASFEMEPSIFLDYDGHLALGWEDAQDCAVELTFAPEAVEYFIEGLGEEGSVPREQIPELVEKLSTV